MDVKTLLKNTYEFAKHNNLTYIKFLYETHSTNKYIAINTTYKMLSIINYLDINWEINFMYFKIHEIDFNLFNRFLNLKDELFSTVKLYIYHNKIQIGVKIIYDDVFIEKIFRYPQLINIAVAFDKTSRKITYNNVNIDNVYNLIKQLDVEKFVPVNVHYKFNCLVHTSLAAELQQISKKYRRSTIQTPHIFLFADTDIQILVIEFKHRHYGVVIENKFNMEKIFETINYLKQIHKIEEKYTVLFSPKNVLYRINEPSDIHMLHIESKL